jgi:hypothetical protein
MRMSRFEHLLEPLIGAAAARRKIGCQITARLAE